MTADQNLVRRCLTARGEEVENWDGQCIELIDVVMHYYAFGTCLTVSPIDKPGIKAKYADELVVDVDRGGFNWLGRASGVLARRACA